MKHWKSILDEVGVILRINERAKAVKGEHPRVRYFSPAERSETVLRERLPRNPVNKQAALLLCRSNDWLSFPPDRPAEKPKPKKEQKMKGGLSEDTVGQQREGFQPHVDHRIPKGKNPEDYVDYDYICTRIIDTINKQPQQLTALARAAIDARAVLDENMDQLGGQMEKFTARVKVALEDLRQSRFAFVTETAAMLNPLKEVRQFLLGNDYEREINRLKDFVDLCERLQVLKKNGTLDALADTIIKLAVT